MHIYTYTGAAGQPRRPCVCEGDRLLAVGPCTGSRQIFEALAKVNGAASAPLSLRFSREAELLLMLLTPTLD